MKRGRSGTDDGPWFSMRVLNSLHNELGRCVLWTDPVELQWIRSVGIRASPSQSFKLLGLSLGKMVVL